MREITGDLWNVKADVRVITTNLEVNHQGQAVMGRGVALQCKQRFRGIEYILGRLIEGTTTKLVHTILSPTNEVLVFFPVKYHWREYARISLILKSLGELIEEANKEGWTKIVMPRPGCGNGGLDWDVVGPILRASLDERFTVVQR